ncbi:suppressor of lurcher protein 1 [Caerostris darwini]|uniref:Suppressor of lurcher protein 1 n=1 Tax=Caerostris darwini TaxID=1538125 RepID=A0AAV4RYG5_9ARAC|nr:suppressor of lurcher protein 1 [Caerostris darwini]
MSRQSCVGSTSIVRTGATGLSRRPTTPACIPETRSATTSSRGRPKERVHITFNKFDVDGIPPCTTDTASDYVEFSNFRTVDRGYPRHCGVKKPKFIESQGDFFRVTFKSNDKFDGTGFEALYHFKPYIDQSAVQRISSTSVNSTSSDVVAVNTYTLILVPLVMMMVINV